MKLLLDTNAISRLFSGDKAVLAALNQADKVYLSIFVLGELWTGFYGRSRQKENHALLQRFMEKPTVTVLTADAETAALFGRLSVYTALMIAAPPNWD